MIDEPVPSRRPILASVAASRAADTEADGWIVRVLDADDLGRLAGLPAERVAWVEVPLDLAHRRELDEFSVDVLLTDPAAQAPHLYRLARLRDPHLPRLSIPAAPGLAQAAAIGMALGFPLRLLPIQPGPQALAELEATLERYLHDPQVSEPVEPFHSALAALLHGEPTTLWDAVERDPAWFRREPPEPADLGPECVSCPVGSWCAGWFKWPDPDYDCAGVLRLFAQLERTALSLRADLAEARELIP